MTSDEKTINSLTLDQDEDESSIISPFMSKARKRLQSKTNKKITTQDDLMSLYYLNPSYWSKLAKRANVHLSQLEDAEDEEVSTTNTANDAVTVPTNSQVQVSTKDPSANKEIEWYHIMKNKYQNYVSDSKTDEKQFYANLDREIKRRKKAMEELEEGGEKMERLLQFLDHVKLEDDQLPSKPVEPYKVDNHLPLQETQSHIESSVNNEPTTNVSKPNEIIKPASDDVVEILSSSEEEEQKAEPEHKQESIPQERYDEYTTDRSSSQDGYEYSDERDSYNEESEHAESANEISDDENKHEDEEYPQNDYEEESEESEEESALESEHNQSPESHSYQTWPPRISVVPTAYDNEPEDVEEQDEEESHESPDEHGDYQYSDANAQGSSNNDYSESDNDETHSHDYYNGIQEGYALNTNTRDEYESNGVDTLSEGDQVNGNLSDEEQAYDEHAVSQQGKSNEEPIELGSESESSDGYKHSIEPQNDEGIPPSGVPNEVITPDLPQGDDYWAKIAELADQEPSSHVGSKAYPSEQDYNDDDDVVSSSSTNEGSSEKTGYIYVHPSDDEKKEDVIEEPENSCSSVDTSNIDPDLFQTAIEGVNEPTGPIGSELKVDNEVPEVGSNVSTKVTAEDTINADSKVTNASGGEKLPADEKILSLTDQNEPVKMEEKEKPAGSKEDTKKLPEPVKIVTPEPPKLNPSLLEMLDHSITIHNLRSAGEEVDESISSPNLLPQNVLGSLASPERKNTSEQNLKPATPLGSASFVGESSFNNITDEKKEKIEVAEKTEQEEVPALDTTKEGEEPHSVIKEQTSASPISVLSESSIMSGESESSLDQSTYATALYNQTVSGSPEVLPANQTMYIEDDEENPDKNKASDEEQSWEKSTGLSEVEEGSDESLSDAEVDKALAENPYNYYDDDIVTSSSMSESSETVTEVEPPHGEKRKLDEASGSFVDKVRKITGFNWLKNLIENSQTVKSPAATESNVSDHLEITPKEKNGEAEKLEIDENETVEGKPLGNIIDAANKFANEAMLSSSSLLVNETSEEEQNPEIEAKQTVVEDKELASDTEKMVGDKPIDQEISGSVNETLELVNSGNEDKGTAKPVENVAAEKVAASDIEKSDKVAPEQDGQYQVNDEVKIEEPEKDSGLEEEKIEVDNQKGEISEKHPGTAENINTELKDEAKHTEDEIVTDQPEKKSAEISVEEPEQVASGDEHISKTELKAPEIDVAHHSEDIKPPEESYSFIDTCKSLLKGVSVHLPFGNVDEPARDLETDQSTEDTKEETDENGGEEIQDGKKEQPVKESLSEEETLEEASEKEIEKSELEGTETPYEINQPEAEKQPEEKKAEEKLPETAKVDAEVLEEEKEQHEIANQVVDNKSETEKAEADEGPNDSFSSLKEPEPEGPEVQKQEIEERNVENHFDEEEFQKVAKEGERKSETLSEPEKQVTAKLPDTEQPEPEEPVEQIIVKPEPERIDEDEMDIDSISKISVKMPVEERSISKPIETIVVKPLTDLGNTPDLKPAESSETEEEETQTIVVKKRGRRGRSRKRSYSYSRGKVDVDANGDFVSKRTRSRSPSLKRDSSSRISSAESEPEPVVTSKPKAVPTALKSLMQEASEFLNDDQVPEAGRTRSSKRLLLTREATREEVQDEGEKNDQEQRNEEPSTPVAMRLRGTRGRIEERRRRLRKRRAQASQGVIENQRKRTRRGRGGRIIWNTRSRKSRFNGRGRSFKKSKKE